MNRIARLLLVLLVAICLLSLAACGSDDASSTSTGAGKAATTAEKDATKDVPFKSVENGLPESQPKPTNCAGKRIAWLAPLNANESINNLSRALAAYAKVVGAKVTLYDGAGNPDKQVSQFQQALADKYDGILAFPLDARALGPLLARAEKAKVPVIGSDVVLEDPSKPEGYVSQIWQRRDELMYIEAKEAARRLGAGAKVAIIGSVIPVPTLKYAAERATYWAQQFGLEVVGQADNATDDIAGGSKAMTQILSKYPDVQGVLAYNEDSAVGASSTARAQGKRDLVLMGINGGSLGFDAVRDGRITGTVQIQVQVSAQQMIYGTCHALAGDEVPPTLLAGDPKLVTKETIDSVPTLKQAIDAIK